MQAAYIISRSSLKILNKKEEFDVTKYLHFLFPISICHIYHKVFIPFLLTSIEDHSSLQTETINRYGIHLKH